MAESIMSILKKWWLALIIGILSLILGFIVVANPGRGIGFAKIFVIIDFIAVGVISVISVIARRKEIPAWGWNLAGAIILLILGIVIAVTPGLPEMIMMFMFTFGFLLKGIQGIFQAFEFKKEGVPGWGWTLAFSILVVILGIMLVANPLAAFLSIDLLVAIALIAFGISMISTAIAMSKAKSAIDMEVKEYNDAVDKINKEVEKYTE